MIKRKSFARSSRFAPCQGVELHSHCASGNHRCSHETPPSSREWSSTPIQATPRPCRAAKRRSESSSFLPVGADPMPSALARDVSRDTNSPAPTRKLPSIDAKTWGPWVRTAPGIGRSARFVGRDGLAPGATHELVENQLVDRLVDRADAAVAIHEVNLTGMLAHPVCVVVDTLDDDRLVEGAIGVGPDTATRGHGPVARNGFADLVPRPGDKRIAACGPVQLVMTTLRTRY